MILPDSLKDCDLTQDMENEICAKSAGRESGHLAWSL